MLFTIYRWLRKRWRRLPCWIEHDWESVHPDGGDLLQCTRCQKERLLSDDRCLGEHDFVVVKPENPYWKECTRCRKIDYNPPERE